MKTTLYLVTNGDEYAYWSRERGCWDTVKAFSGECLHNRYDADHASDAFNTRRDEDTPIWAIRKVSIEVLPA